ncbi:zinc finger protein 131-like [Neocloeon triangulifer]|uniref:zinc finger protein 131-like n=1 Tax=Neocloeon triangulifer TaxID=2078957 RepID=UPI00286F9ADD|nr:zinc finger protein 131-like [Neocloeon triangulifer]XP_059484157.1 zinc finger protein 131-like [Neocloeon triangulifer]
MPNYKIGKRGALSVIRSALPKKIQKITQASHEVDHAYGHSSSSCALKFELIQLLADCCDVKIESNDSNSAAPSPLCDSVPTNYDCSEEYDRCLSPDLVKVKVEPGIEMQLKESSLSSDHAIIIKCGEDLDLSPSKISSIASEIMQPLDDKSLPLISVKNFKCDDEEYSLPDEDSASIEGNENQEDSDFVLNVEYKTEQNVQTSYKFFKCSDCDHIFPSHKKLVEHVQGNTSNPSLKVLYKQKCGFFCEICKMRLMNHKSLLLHKVQKHSTIFQTIVPVKKEEMAVPCGMICKICSKQFNSQTEMDSHIKAHENFMPFECRKCYKRFKFHNEMKEHNAEVHEVSKDARGWYMCKLCDGTFKKLIDYKSHTYQDHCVIFNELYNITKTC